MTKIVEPGDIRIKRITLSNKSLSASISPLDQLDAIDIFEDMSKPTLFATFAFTDSINLFEKFPIIGEEVITLEIQTPGIARSTMYKFRAFEVANVTRDDGGKLNRFVLRCVSEEHLYNGSSLITQSYKNVISNIVPEILTKYLRSEKDIIVDDTKGIQTIAVPKLNPLQLIDMCRQRAVSKEFASSSYVFFENQAGFNFKTIESLIKEGQKTIGSRVFNTNQDPSSSAQAQAESFRTILQYDNIVRADSNVKAQMGAFKAVTKSFDLATKQLASTNFDVQDVFDKISKANKSEQMPNSEDFIGKFGSGNPRQFFTAKDSTRPDNFIDTMVAVRNSFSVLMNGNVTRVLVHGDTGLKAGDLVTLNLPETSGTTDRKKLDKMSSGNYLILRLRHIITPSTKSKHQIVFDCARMGI